MIRYALRCAKGHDFEAWFRSSGEFDRQRDAGHVTCAVCGGTEVEKAVMAPSVTARAREEAPLSTPSGPAEQLLREMRAHVEKNSDYVGRDFAAEARRIHEGEAEQRGIWGEATVKDAKDLKDDGIQVAPIPWMRRGDS